MPNSMVHRVFNLLLIILLLIFTALSVLKAQVTEDWVVRYFPHVTDGESKGSCIAVDPSGFVYVSGTTQDGWSYNDFTTIKYDSSGIEAWVSHYIGPLPSASYLFFNVHDIAVDDTGNVYVTGENPSIGSYGARTDFTTIKYDSGGTELWVARDNWTSDMDATPTDMTLDSAGNIYVAGYYGTTRSDMVVVKYNSAGAKQWVAKYNGSANGGDFATALYVDSSGNVYVGGHSDRTRSDYLYDFVIIKYNNSGTKLWEARYNEGVNTSFVSRAMTVDPLGNVYLTGYREWTLSGLRFYATVKYDSAGTHLWTAHYFHYQDEAVDIYVDSAGNVYVTGESEDSKTDIDFATVKYDNSGTELWVARYNGPGNRRDFATKICGDSAGNVYVCGFCSGTMSTYIAIKYDTDGNELWIYRYPATPYDGYFCNDMALDEWGNIYLTGEESIGSYPWGSYILTIKLSELHVDAQSGILIKTILLCIFMFAFLFCFRQV